ncbi:MAG TPA: acetamidase/formamidase family protein [Acidocella sp.]|nr:acetamidase/formamidase family protein [Acidocella sp.]
MNLSRFDAEAYPLEQRNAAWRETLRRYGIVSYRSTAAPRGDFLALTSRQGCCFIQINADPQSLRWEETSHDLWLSFLLEGAGQLADGTTLRAQDLCIGTMAQLGSVTLTEAFRLLLIVLPAEGLDDRLRRMAFDGGLVATAHGMGQVLTGFLATIAETLGALDAARLHPLELSLSELLIAALTGTEAPTLPGGIDRRKSAFQRLMQAIEARLPDSELTLASLAESEGMSVRAVQKLFQRENLSFAQYVRRRRLQRTAQDLRDPQQNKLLVADIGFRWGFSDPAHFSRTFREQYGVTPGTFREQNFAPADTELGDLTRGRPKISALPRRQIYAPAIDDHGDEASGKQETDQQEGVAHHHLPLNARSIHWGYFSKSLSPILTVRSGDIVTIETLTQHATDDWARMVEGDAAAEHVMAWTRDLKTIDRRGAGPMDASVYGRGAGEGFGVHICTGPVAVEGAAPGDVLEIEILDIVPRPSQAPAFAGRSFGSNAAVWWGYHYKELLTEPRPREVVTLYELVRQGENLCAHALYNFRWTPQRDPYGVLHPTIDYPGVPVDHGTIKKIDDPLKGIRIPVRPHFGIISLAPDYAGALDSTPPSAFGGNIDNWRLGAGSRLYLPVAVAGALLSVGDPHASQGDGEVSGTAIECSLTGTLKLTLHRRGQKRGLLKDLTYPLIETADAWIVQGFSHPNYLAELGETALSEVYKKSSLDAAMRDAFRKARRLLMAGWGLSEDAAISLLSVGIDFGITQVVDGNLGVHATIPKALFRD